MGPVCPVKHTTIGCVFYSAHQRGIMSKYEIVLRQQRNRSTLEVMNSGNTPRTVARVNIAQEVVGDDGINHSALESAGRRLLEMSSKSLLGPAGWASTVGKWMELGCRLSYSVVEADDFGWSNLAGYAVTIEGAVALAKRLLIGYCQEGDTLGVTQGADGWQQPYINDNTIVEVLTAGGPLDNHVVIRNRAALKTTTTTMLGMEWPNVTVIHDRRHKAYGSIAFLVQCDDDMAATLEDEFFRRWPRQGYGGVVKKLEQGWWRFYTSICCD